MYFYFWELDLQVVVRINAYDLFVELILSRKQAVLGWLKSSTGYLKSRPKL